MCDVCDVRDVRGVREASVRRCVLRKGRMEWGVDLVMVPFFFLGGEWPVWLLLRRVRRVADFGVDVLGVIVERMKSSSSLSSSMLTSSLLLSLSLGSDWVGVGVFSVLGGRGLSVMIVVIMVVGVVVLRGGGWGVVVSCCVACQRPHL